MACYRLIALDLDGTSVADGQAPTPAVAAAVSAAQARDVTIVLATGRPYVSAARYAALFGLGGPVVCYQGALVKETTGDRATLLAHAMPREPLHELLMLAQTQRLKLDIYSERAIYVTEMRHPQAFYDLWFGLEVQRADSYEAALRMMGAEGLVPLKCLSIGEPADNDRLTEDLRRQFDGRLTIMRSHHLFVEAISPAASKGKALAFLAETLGVARDEVIAVGDSGNDLSMVEWAGMGVAVGNASAEVKAAADWVAPPVWEDGVAAVIERFVLRNGKL